MDSTLPDTLSPKPSLNAWVTSLLHTPCPDGRMEVLEKVHELRWPESQRNEERERENVYVCVREWESKCDLCGNLEAEG